MTRALGTWPWIELGNGVVASAVVLLARYGANVGVLASAGLGLASYAGYRLAFGTDPTAEDLYASIEGYDPADAARTMEAAHVALARARAAMQAIKGLPHEAALAGVVAAGARVVAQVEAEPRLLPAAQRFLDVYLDGIAGAAEKYAHLRARSENDVLRSQFADLLAEAKSVCARQERALVADEEDDLSMDITVLQRRMALAKR